MRAKLKDQQKGFTIIEVLIVLAIAGLIILIVFLAVPALQRNSRNTQRKNDASRMSALIAEHVTNNNGQVPTGFGTGANQLNVGATNFTALAVPAGFGTAGTLDTMGVTIGSRCENNALVGGAGRSYAVTYQVETSGGDQPQCI